MAKQLQLRHGSTAHASMFTGALAEPIFDTERKDIRVYDGVKAGGYEIPSIIEQQLPTEENDYTWYIKYSNGWCEQGGIIPASTTTTTNLLVEMADANYQVMATGLFANAGADIRVKYVQLRTTTTFTTSAYSNISYMWEVKGIYNQGE